MVSSYEEWLNERLGKPVLWSKHAAVTAVTRNIYNEDVKDAILFGDITRKDSSEQGSKITVKKQLHDPQYESIVVVYIDLPTHFYVISNHFHKRKRGGTDA